MNRQAYSEALAGAQAILPIAFGVVIYGLAFGVLASRAGLTPTEIGMMGFLVLAGSSQIVAVERLAAGAGLIAALVAAGALNLRLLLVTASVRDFFIGRPMWQQVVGAHLTTDENWALTLSKRSQGARIGFWFLMGSGGVLLLGWVTASTLGVMFASKIPDPETYAIDFAFPAAFIAIARSLWRTRSDLLPWVMSITIVALLLAFDVIAPAWAIIWGGLGGAITAGLCRDV